MSTLFKASRDHGPETCMAILAVVATVPHVASNDAESTHVEPSVRDGAT